MPAISAEDFVPWANYHLSVGEPNGQDLEPQIQIERLGRVHVSDQEGLGIERFSATAEMFWEHLLGVRQLMAYKASLKQLGDPPRPFPLALTGRGWSFSDVVGTARGRPCPSMLILDGLSGAVLLGKDQKEACFKDTSVALVGGGTRLRELAHWAARHQLSIINSGTHLGATIAGAIGTASHGSRLDRGGLQDMVHGLHLVTGIGESVWIERETRPVLTDDARFKLAPGDTQCRLVRCDAMFEDALVHLGCMGIVNAVAVELESPQRLERLHLAKTIDNDWLISLANGDWAAIADAFNLGDKSPLFYELTIDPHAWDGGYALHNAYFEARPGVVQPIRPAARSLADAIAGAGLLGLRQPAGFKGNASKALSKSFIERPINMKYFLASSCANSIFEHYRLLGGFDTSAKTVDSGAWKDLHPDEITGGYPGALWNASWAIDRAKLPQAIPAICTAVRDLPRSFLFTIRFVNGRNGTLDFARFADTAVIDIDGLSPWICEKVERRWIAYNGGQESGIEPQLEELGALRWVLPLGAARVADALQQARIDFSNHWAKYGSITPPAVHTAFGEPGNANLGLGRWRTTRENLLTSDFARAIFWNWGAVRMGVLDQPQNVPDLSDLETRGKSCET